MEREGKFIIASIKDAGNVIKKSDDRYNYYVELLTNLRVLINKYYQQKGVQKKSNIDSQENDFFYDLEQLPQWQ